MTNNVAKYKNDVIFSGGIVNEKTYLGTIGSFLDRTAELKEEYLETISCAGQSYSFGIGSNIPVDQTIPCVISELSMQFDDDDFEVLYIEAMWSGLNSVALVYGEINNRWRRYDD